MSMIRTSLPTLAIALILAGLISAGPAARAASDDRDGDSQTSVVSTRGLDLASPAGRAALHRRISIAAARVCDTFDVRDLRSTRDYEQCRAQAIDDAEVQARVLIARAGSGTMAVADAGNPRP